MLVSRSLYPLEYTSTLKSSPVFLIEPAPVTTLWSFLHTIPDHRRAQGKRHSLPLVLILTILAICSGATSYQAIYEWTKNYQNQLKDQVSFLAFHTPDQSTFHRVFAKLDYPAFEDALSDWLKSITYVEKGEGISIDGKTTNRDTLHLVAAFAHKTKGVLFQMSTDTKGKELVVAPQVLDKIKVSDRVITTDALHAQRDFCESITNSGGGFVIVVKSNQEKLHQDIKLFFEHPPFKTKLDSVQTIEKSKGRIERRIVWVSDEPSLIDYLSWPGLNYIFKCERLITQKDQTLTSETVYGIAALKGELHTATNVSKYLRDHWSIENNLHRVRDTSFNEDKSTIRTGNAPKVMAALRNLVISIFNRGKVKSIPTAFRRFQAKPEELFSFLGLTQASYRVIYA